MTAGIPALEVRGIIKAFAGVKVLHGIDLTVGPGEVVALLGENGAGKSTLLNIIGGVIKPDLGEILLNGVSRRWSSPREALDAGIAFVHQELSAIRTLSVAENIFLGDYRARRGFINRKAMARDARRLLQSVGAEHIPPSKIMGQLGNADQQIVAIAKAQAQPLRLLILDEPTSSLTPHEVEGLFKITRRLRSEGVGIIFISHRFEEVFAIADRVVVLRDGALVSDRPAGDATRDHAIEDMTGRAGFFAGQRQETRQGEQSLRVDRLRYHHVGPLTFTLRAGEVLGIFGLVGAGRTELLEVLAGARRADGGGALFHDGAGLPGSPKEAWARGIAILPEDRQRCGISASLSVLENTRLAARRKGPAWLVDRQEKALALPLLRRLAVRTAGMMQPVGTLSGGNQQKVVLARCLSVSPSLLLLDEPTRGIDVRTKAELYTLIGELAASGVTVIFTSSELPELLALASTVLVIAHGQQTLLLPNGDLSEAQVLGAAFQLAAAAV